MTIDNQTKGTASKNHLQDDWKNLLNPGEKVLWQGRPNTGLRWRKPSAFKFPMTLIFAGTAIYIQLGVYGKSNPKFMLLFGSGFVAVGVFLTVGLFFWDSYKRRYTRYILTNKRAFVATNHWKKNLRILPILKDTLVDFRPGTESTVILEFETRDTRKEKKTIEHGFELIDEGTKVFSLISKIQSNLI